jgi:hypothetical protein
MKSGVSFVWDHALTFPNHGAPRQAFGIMTKPLMRWCAC